MSFFGFDTSLPRDRQAGQQARGIFENPDPFAEVARAQAQGLHDADDDAIDFEDTYDGLGDQLDDDQDEFNDDTFGGGNNTVGKDFDFFGTTAQVSDAINEEQIRYTLQHPKPSAPLSPGAGQRQAPAVASIPRLPKKSGYERYQDSEFIPEIAAKSSVWGTTAQKKHVAEPAPVASMPAASRKMMSLEEVEAQMRHQPQQFPHATLPIAPHPDVVQGVPRGQKLPPFPEGFPPLPPGELMALEQQALALGISPIQLLQRLQQMPPNKSPLQPLPRQPPAAPQQQRQPPPTHRQQQHAPSTSQGAPVITDPQQLMNMSEEQRVNYLMEDAKRAKRNHKIFLLSRGNGLMTPQDKNFITRIQLQQLVAATGNVNDTDSESLLSEDFYYQVYSQIRGAPRQHPRQPLGHFAQTYLFQTGNRTGGHGRRQYQNADNHMQRMQQQVQRAVEAAKAKPKNKQLIIEGSLGKISFSNAKTPKPLLNIKKPEGSDGLKPKRATADLSAIDRKSVLNNIESVYTILMQMEDLERTMPPPPEEGDAESIEKHLEWRQKMQALNQELWQDMKVLEPIVPGSTVPHPFIAFLSYPKGKKAIPRLFRQIDQEQRVTVLTMIVVNLDTLDVVRKGQLNTGETQLPAAAREDIELFSQTVMPSLLGYVNEAPFNIIIGLLGLVLAQTHVLFVAKTRVGLGIMTMLLSRAEIVKEAGQADEHDWQQWIEKFNQLFDSLEPGLTHIFPGSINTGDDMYVWQFLAAVGIGASPDQQQRLVIAVKDRVMETVAQSKTLPADMASQRLSNVNLFMRAIGLDVELLG
ncbi:putative topoisomerase II associated protein [Talaromyces proteolyticus]|uniref:Topoisomerase II associated protein n=1 Tax=Talaromyces proteolyticus TaxID=1131652 RepID=A0AAD4KP65_9EURO|nr:putative topoisomerase II associated protein [Talaromyces proteolyticus]KAH8696136.1 putative topoisomerase II associated protein [Talaromyces proteolyticus]